MNTNERYKVFMKRVSQVTLPDEDEQLARARVFARELAAGVNYGLWPHVDTANQSIVQTYIKERWQSQAPNPRLLRTLEYFSEGSTLTKAAFDLLDESPLADVFISYRRHESSAFALLVLTRLKAEGLNAFLDMAIEPGENWHAHVREEIQKRNYFVLLLGKATLTSEVVKQEIGWALEAGSVILPIWHNEFTLDDLAAASLPDDIRRILNSNNAICVVPESALGYNNAIVHLLNRFGITP